MIQLRLKFKQDQSQVQEIEIVDGELLKDAVTRALDGVPLGTDTPDKVFNAVVNGNIIDGDFWIFTKLKETDNVIISPKIKDGESGQILKQIAIIAISVAAGVLTQNPALGLSVYQAAFAAAAITIGASLLLNALIPPPVPKTGEISNQGSIESSQMYAISGQSNEVRRLSTVPKVYGTHRIYPNIAAMPYTELTVDPATGKSIQYYYAIYDFGLGTVDVHDIKIGDTPLTTDGFNNFQYNLVDLNRPGSPEDAFDSNLATEFTLYKGRREVTPLSTVLTNGSVVTQNSDANASSSDQEIVIDMVADRGLYGYSSDGAFGERSVRLHVEFALVGTSDWHDYNDLNYVHNYHIVGGNDFTDFDVSIIPTLLTYNPLGGNVDEFYNASLSAETRYSGANPYDHYQNFRVDYYFYQNKLLVPAPTNLYNEYNIGAKVFYRGFFIGNITAAAPHTNPAYYKLTLDRNISQTYPYPAYTMRGSNVNDGPVTWTGTAVNVQTVRTSRHSSGVAVVTGSSTFPVYANFRFRPITVGQYQIRITRISASGTYNTQVQDQLTWIGLTTAYLTPPIQTDKRHVFMEVKIKATDQLNGNIQNLSAVVGSVLPVYDPDTQTWAREITSNPAWVLCDLLTGEVNKKAIAQAKLHMDSIVEWAEYCDEVPDTFNGPRFQTNFVLDYTTTLQEVIAQIGGAAQASLNIIDGKYGVLIDKYRDTPVQIFTPRNSKDFSSTRMYGPRPHGLKVKYIDPNRDWELTEVVVYDDGYDANTATNFEDLTAFACTTNDQAFRFGRYMLAQNRLRQENISLVVDFEHLVCSRGDYVQITQDVMRVGGTPARVKAVAGSTITIDDSIDVDAGEDYGYTYRAADGSVATSTLTPVSAREFTVDGDVPAVGDLIVIGVVGEIVYDCIVKSISPNDDTSANLVLVEKADAIYDAESSSTLPDYDPQISQTTGPHKPPNPVENLTVADITYDCAPTKSGYAYYIDLVWDAPIGSVYDLFEVWVNEGDGYRLYDNTTVKLYRYEVNQARLDIEHGFKVVAVSATGKKLQLVEMPEVTATPDSKSTPPSDVEDFSSNITNQVLQLSWTPVDDCDCFQYVIRFSPDTNDVWESSIPLQTVSSKVTSLAVQARTGVYFIKAQDYAGNFSDTAASIITTIPNLFDLNVIDELNEAPTFDGVTTQAELLGEAVILSEEVPGDVDTVEYYSEGYYEFANLIDLGDNYTSRIQNLIRADGLKKGELMSEWVHLEDVDHLNTALHSQWDVALQYRGTESFAAMSDWDHLYNVDHINFGAGVGFTDWRDIPTTNDVTARILQFRLRLLSLASNVTPRVFDTTVAVDMPDRTDSFENQLSSAGAVTTITYETKFMGPGTSPNVQITIDNGATGDYWVFENKTLEGFGIRFYDKNNVQVARQFDVVAKGYGRRHTATI